MEIAQTGLFVEKKSTCIWIKFQGLTEGILANSPTYSRTIKVPLLCGKWAG